MFDRIKMILLLLIAVFLAFPFQTEVADVRLGPIVILVTLTFALLVREAFRLPRHFDWRHAYTNLRAIPDWQVYSLFLAWCAFAVLLGGQMKNPAQGAWHIYINAIEMPLMYAVVVSAVQTRGFVRQLANVLIPAATLTALVGIVQSLTGGEWLAGLRPQGNMLYLGFLFPYPAEVRDFMQRSNPIELAQLYLLPYSDIFRAYGGMTRHIYLGVFLALTTGVTSGLIWDSAVWRTRALLGIVSRFKP